MSICVGRLDSVLTIWQTMKIVVQLYLQDLEDYLLQVLLIYIPTVGQKLGNDICVDCNVGIDLHDLMSVSKDLVEAEDVARKAKILYNILSMCQKSLTALEKCNKPVIAAVHGPCLGAGVDILTATDIRYCTSDAWFQVKEVSTIICYVNTSLYL